MRKEGPVRKINLIVIHCSATRCDRCLTEHDLLDDHRRRGMDCIGYHICRSLSLNNFPLSRSDNITSIRTFEFSPSSKSMKKTP